MFYSPLLSCHMGGRIFNHELGLKLTVNKDQDAIHRLPRPALTSHVPMSTNVDMTSVVLELFDNVFSLETYIHSSNVSLQENSPFVLTRICELLGGQCITDSIAEGCTVEDSNVDRHGRGALCMTKHRSARQHISK